MPQSSWCEPLRKKPGALLWLIGVVALTFLVGFRHGSPRRCRLCHTGAWSRFPASGTFRELWQVIRDREPRCLAGDVHMLRRANSRIVVQGPERQPVVGGVRIELAQDRRAAYAAKPSMVAGRRFVEGHEALALDPCEVRCSQACTAAKSRSLGLAAHRAMTIQGLGQRPGDLVFHSAAQATSADHARLQDAFLAIRTVPCRARRVEIGSY